MSAFLSPLAKRIYEALINQSGMAPVYDHVPEGEVPLYVLVGEGSAQDAGSKTADHERLAITVWISSTHRGYREVEEQMRLIKPLLHRQDFVLAQGVQVFLKWSGSDTSTESDGRTRKGRMTFEGMTSPS